MNPVVFSLGDNYTSDVDMTTHNNNKTHKCNVNSISTLNDTNETVVSELSTSRQFSDTSAKRNRSVIPIDNRRHGAGRKESRLVSKKGSFQFTNIHVLSCCARLRRYLGDMFTTLLSIRWRYVILLFALGYVLSWLVFAIIWWQIYETNRPSVFSEKEEEERCISGVNNFATALLFSIETQHTIGYGTRAITETCGAAVFVLMLQSVTGVLIQCIITGVVFAKLARPKNRAQTLIFSRNAVICRRDGYFWLMFRVGDMRQSQLICSTLRAMFVKKKVTDEGEVLPFYRYKLTVNTEAEDDFFFMAWPIKAIHRIDESSPLYNYSAEQLSVEHFEIVIVLEGVNESSGMTTQVRTSYIPSEIQWGHRLANLEAYCTENSGFQIDYTHFHETVPVDMPVDSAKECEKYIKEKRSGLIKQSTMFTFTDETDSGHHD